MAARTVRCLFKNMTDETLERESEHLDWGIYTDPWSPPATIAPGAVAEWRSESDGGLLPQGTEGRARYRIAAGEATEFIDLWWDNPYIGRNQSAINIVQDFSSAPSKVFEGAHQIGANVPPNLAKMADGDVEAWVDAVLFVPYIFANASSANDANAVFAVRRKAQVSSPLFGPKAAGAVSSKLNTSTKPAEWDGLWANGAVSVTIANANGGGLTASITDTSVNPPLQLQENFRLGQFGWALNTLALSVHGQAHAIGAAAAAAIVGAAGNSAGTQSAEAHYRVSATIRAALDAHADGRNAKLSERQLDQATKAAVAASKLPKSAVLLSHGIALMLYDDFQDGHKIGGHLLYQRIMPGTGLTLASEELAYFPRLS